MSDYEKIKYHLQLLAESLDARQTPIASLVISNDWSASDLDAAHDIFEIYDQKLEQKQSVNWHNFEREFHERFGLTYQGLKPVVLAFFRNDQWVSVCEAYAGEHHCVEFSEIIARKLRDYNGLLVERVAAIFVRNNIPYVRDTEVRTADEKCIRLDFILSPPGVVIAVEVKSVLNQSAIAHAVQLASEVKSGLVADEFWLVVDGAALADVCLPLPEGAVSILTLDMLEDKLSSGR